MKRLALSSAMPAEDLAALLEAAREIVARNGAECAVETDFLVTDLFPASVTDGLQLLLIFRASDGTLEEYRALKERKSQLVSQSAYSGQAREGVARGMARLLSYPDEKTHSLLQQRD